MLKIRADFLRVAAARRSAAGPGVVLQAADRARIAATLAPGIRVGFTASRKVGNAVARNRAKRRLRAAAASVLPDRGRPGTDYVLIARAGTAGRARSRISIADLESALRRIEAAPVRRDGRSAATRAVASSHEAPSETH